MVGMWATNKRGRAIQPQASGSQLAVLSSSKAVQGKPKRTSKQPVEEHLQAAARLQDCAVEKTAKQLGKKITQIVDEDLGQGRSNDEYSDSSEDELSESDSDELENNKPDTLLRKKKGGKVGEKGKELQKQILWRTRKQKLEVEEEEEEDSTSDGSDAGKLHHSGKKTKLTQYATGLIQAYKKGGLVHPLAGKKHKNTKALAHVATEEPGVVAPGGISNDNNDNIETICCGKIVSIVKIDHIHITDN
ncbi:hypothetical protein NP233_g3928 [Leucocoprinus birnbaumii]|uniref:Uncharacterized protein n=1 Tax=Leucocoprinus birnbaumii TaxID=56174 RepID=A0AAD5VYB0_9AGAR|nr:hypothetical protein NP233_g3928 [Leucocoprinus birnbaumii]